MNIFFSISTSTLQFDLQSNKPEVSRILGIQTECNLSVWSEMDYYEELKNKNSLILTAKQENEIVGFLATRLSNPREQPGKYEDADILNFGVSQKFQNRGIGALLLKTFLIKAERMKLGTIWLEVRESNARAIKFYKYKGFIEVQIRKNFYRQPLENAILMKLDLPPLPI